MVKLTQNIEAAYEVESTYGSPPGSNLYHLGLLDTFDPRAVEMNITPVPSLGQSTDAFQRRTRRRQRENTIGTRKKRA